MIRLIRIFVLGVALLGLTGSAFAQTPPNPAPVQPAPAASVYEGVEMNNSYLKFVLTQDGKVVMHDAVSNGPVRGTYTRNGNNFSFTFANCVYEGVLNGNTIAGQARFTKDATGTWEFTVDVR